MLRTLAVVAALAFAASAAMSAPALDAKGRCRDGGKFAPASACASPAKADHPKNCKKGKACGNTCISMKDVCHK